MISTATTEPFPILGDTVVIGEIPASELAERFGTPLYAYDEGRIRARARQLFDEIRYRQLRVFYSMKANANPGVLRIVRDEGLNVDVCSPGDLALADAAGFTDEQMSYAGFAMSDNEVLAVAARPGITFIADSVTQALRYAEAREGARIGLRVNPGIEAGFHAHLQAGSRTSKFGLHRAQIAPLLDDLRERGASVVGLHGHVGSEVAGAEVHLRLLRDLADIGSNLMDLRWLSVGGGFGIPFSPSVPAYDLAELSTGATVVLDELSRRMGHQVELRLEPGTYVCMDAGFIIGTITEVKMPVPDEQGETPAFVCVDTSTNHVPSVLLYSTEHPIALAERPEAPATGGFDVVGNLMQAGDILRRDLPLADPQPGEHIVIAKCGGYSMSRATTFNERPLPREVIVDGAEATLAPSVNAPGG